jgi:NAD(P)-dependent dehydrogenase (short-subunit alcohol dehydrogenase family)
MAACQRDAYILATREKRGAPQMSDTLPLQGKLAFITGSGRGLGRTIAERLQLLGADIVLHDISEEAPAKFGEVASLSALATEFARRKGRAIAVTGDMGPIDILVNCAGGDIGADGNKPSPSTPTQFELADVTAVLNRNLVGTMLMCRAVAPDMVRRKQGAIVNFGSLLAHQATATEIGYSCAKAAIVHYTRCLAIELRTAGVRANVISPGPAKTARFLATRTTDPQMMEEGPSLQRYATPAEIAAAVAFLAGPHSRFISGQVLRVDGALSVHTS